jgi:hypothetical protein
MKEKTYLFSYFGNKDRELEEVYRNIKNEIINCETIIEPFGGSFALIRYLVNNDINKEFIVNDNDKLLIETYSYMINEEQNLLMRNKIRDFLIDIDKEKYNNMKKDRNIFSFLFTHLYYQINFGLFPIRKVNIDYDRIEKFIKYKNIIFKNEDAYDIIEKHKNNDKAYIFLDPPYLFTYNYYNSGWNDRFLDIINNFYDYKCKILISLENHPLILALLKCNNIEVFFETKIKFRGSRQSKNIYFKNY